MNARRTLYSNNYGGYVELSDERYVILKGSSHSFIGYGPGEIVRKISGVDNSDILGYHFMNGYSTVCREHAEQAEFCGIEDKFLAELKN